MSNDIIPTRYIDEYESADLDIQAEDKDARLELLYSKLTNRLIRNIIASLHGIDQGPQTPEDIAQVYEIDISVVLQVEENSKYFLEGHITYGEFLENLGFVSADVYVGELYDSVKGEVRENIYITSLIDRLDAHLRENKGKLRKRQIQSITKLIDFLERGKTDGIIKQPMGSGKTRIIAETSKAFQEPSMTLANKVGLIGQTYDSMVGNPQRDKEGVGFAPEEVYTINHEHKTAVEQVEAFLEDTEKSDTPLNIIMTYQSLLSLHKRHPAVYQRLVDYISIFNTDEAHRSLGERTQEALDVDLVSEDDQEISLDDEGTEDEALELLKKLNKVFLRYSATPRLSKKQIQDIYNTEIIDWVRIQESVEDGTLILPTRKGVGTFVAKINTDELATDRSMTEGLLDDLSENDRFENEETGETLNESMMREYLQIKEEHDGYMPGVAFCRTVKDAEERMADARSKGLRCMRCTSDVPGVDPANNVTQDEATDMIQNDELDLIFTVSKVGEGWDVPTLRCALWFTPSNSPARILQGNGRIMRTLPPGSPRPPKSSDNTYILEPMFMVNYEIDGKEREPGGGGAGVPTGGGKTREGDKRQNSKYKSRSFYQLMVDNDEYDAKDIETLDSGLEIEYPFDFQNHDHLRELIGGIENLIVNGKGVSLVKLIFNNEGKQWSISGSQIGGALFNTYAPNSSHAEELAKLLWPEEAVELLPIEAFDIHNDNHLREIIEVIGNLIKNGKAKDINGLTFKHKKKKWSVSGKQIGFALFGVKSPTLANVEALAKRLWPEQYESLIFNIHNDDHWRELIGDIKNLIANGKALNLGLLNFEHKEKGWSVSGGQIGHALFDNYSPGISDGLQLAKRLWPEQYESLIFNIHNDDHWRELIGDIKNLIVNGKGINIKSSNFEHKEKGWSISGARIGIALFNKKSLNILDTEKLAKRLWPEQYESLIFDINNDNHWRELIGDVRNLIVNGKGINLRNVDFEHKEKGWSISGIRISFALFNTKSPNSLHAEQLARRLWPEEVAKLLGDSA